MGKKEKAYDPKKLSKEQQELHQNKGSDFRRGIACTELVEPIPLFNDAECEEVFEGKNNSYIVLGRDRTGPQLVEPNQPQQGPYGPKGYPKSGMIDIVVGRHGADPTPFKKIGKKEIPVVVDPDFFDDAARIYISQKTDIDWNFRIGVNPEKSQSFGYSGIGIKADDVRVIGRYGIKLVTGTDVRDSLGGRVWGIDGIDLIAGNDDTDMQNFVKGENMLECLRDVLFNVNALNGLLHAFAEYQLKINKAFTEHTHISPFCGLPTAPSEGAVIKGRHNMIKQVKDCMTGLTINKINTAQLTSKYFEPWGEKYLLSRYNRTN